MMNQSNPFRHLAVAAFACLLTASCNDVTDDGTTLPDGTYPMTFTASVDGLTATRATPDNSWAGGEEVAIQIGSEVKKYTAANDGSLTIAENGTPFYWQTTSDITVNAWYPYSTTKPTVAELRVKANQSEGNNYQSSDYLEAVDATVTFNTPAALIFKHRTAKVVVTLKAGEGVTDVANAAVTFVNQTGVDGGGTEVTPKTETIAGVTTYTALVIPQQMKGKKFIKVTIGTGSAARDYYYPPTGSTDANLEAGKQYNYTITVKKTGLEVTVTGNGTAWTNTSIDTDPDAAVTYRITAPEGVTIAAASDGSLSGSNGSYTLSDGNVVTITNDYGARIGIKGLYEVADGTTYTLKSDLLIEYSLADARVGDFYCKNSSGEGYLIPGDIAQLTEERQAACIGIVYSTDVNRIGKAAKEVLTDKGITPHGLVMALTNASNSCNWGEPFRDENSNGSEGEPFKENTDPLQKQYNNVDGYGETHWIIDTYGNDGTALPDTYTAFYHASRYGTAESNTGKYAAPSNTTGWFIPSMGQWWDILSNLGKIDLTSYRNSADSYANIGRTVPTAVYNINTYLQKISDATPFSTNTYFCSSSEYNHLSACNVLFYSDGGLGLHYSGKERSERRLRCSFAF